MPTNTGRYIPNKGKGGGGRWDKGGAKGGGEDKVNKVFFFIKKMILKGLNFMSKRAKLHVKKDKT